jgi:hypothetical protein
MLENQDEVPEVIQPDEVPNGDQQLEFDLGEGNNGAEVEIGDDGQAQVRAVDAKDETGTKKPDDTKDHEEYSTKVRKRIEKMTAKLREAERREQAALEYARQVQANLQEAQSRVQSLDQGYLNEYKGRVDSQLAIAEANLQDAVERGDGKAVVDAQKLLSQLMIQQEKLSQATSQRQRVAAQQPVQQPVQQAYQPAPAPRVDTRAEQWAEQNEWFGSDQPMTFAAFGVHTQLAEEGFDLSSEEYYDELDRRIRKEFPHKFKKQQVDTRSATAPGIAPATRGITASPNGRRTIKLTPSEVAMAKKIGVPLEEYAKYVRR